MSAKIANPFRNAVVVGNNIDPEAYRRQEPGVGRGSPAYIMTRTELMMFRTCPAKWRNGWQKDGTESTEFGSMVDCRVLTPERFEKVYAVEPETVTATKTMSIVRNGEAAAGELVPWNPQCKEAQEWRQMQQRHGLEVLSSDERAECEAAFRALASDMRVAELLLTSDPQVMVTAEYADSATGLVIPFRTLIDLVPRGGDCLVDLKTARNGAPRAWQKEVDQRDYDAQAAVCLDLWNLATGEDRKLFRHIIVENQPPFLVCRRLLGEGFVTFGRQKVVESLEYYCRCLKDNHWPDWDEGSPYDGWTLLEPDQYHSCLRAPMNTQGKIPDPDWV